MSDISDSRVGVVVLTHNRPTELAHCLQQLVELPERPQMVVVDNASDTGDHEALKRRFPAVHWVRCGRNLGAAGRNAGVARLRTPYVAFCDDDTWWEAGALHRAAEIMDAHPHVAALAARVLVGPDKRLDPTCDRMAMSPLDGAGLPGPALAGFMAGAVVVRRRVYRRAGGYEPHLFIGAEETLLSLDLLSQGWAITYVDTVVTHHHPSGTRDAEGRRLMLWRNRLWIAWLRLPVRSMWREFQDVWAEAAADGSRMRLLRSVVTGASWLLWRRRVVPAHVARMWDRARRADCTASSHMVMGNGVPLTR